MKNKELMFTIVEKTGNGMSTCAKRISEYVERCLSNENRR